MLANNYQSVQKHERITKLMRFIEEHPGLKLEDLGPMAQQHVFHGKHTLKKVESYFYSLLREGDIYTSIDGEVYSTDHRTEASP